MIQRVVFWPLFFASHCLALALLSWHLLAQVHFGYPLGYQWLGLDETIATYAPQNLYKRDFEHTSAAEHWRLFGEITDAVQSGGKGLADIRYTAGNGPATPLLHDAEIIHLRDVAQLIDRFYLAGGTAALAWALGIAVAWRRRWALPPPWKVVLGFAAALTAAGAVVLFIGAEKVFYWLHVQIFPAGHQWFFYYQESLMTTLMKAPDIFAFISVLLLLSFAALWLLTTQGVYRLLQPGRA